MISYARLLNCSLCILVAMALGLLRPDSVASAQMGVFQPAPALVEEVSRLVTRHFYDREVVRHVWRDARTAHTAGLSADATSEEVAAALDGMLEELGASHTGHYTRDELAYYELVDIFARSDLGRRLRALFDDGRIAYTGIGVVPRRVAGRTFLAAVYHGGPADRAGLMVGDEILSADGAPFDPIAWFAGKAGEPVSLEVRRIEGGSDLQGRGRARAHPTEPAVPGGNALERSGHRVPGPRAGLRSNLVLRPTGLPRAPDRGARPGAGSSMSTG